MRPRAGTWSPFIAAIPLAEKEKVNPSLFHGPAKRPPAGGVLHMAKRGESGDGEWWFTGAQNEATPTQSYFLLCDTLPSRLVFGVDGSNVQYSIDVLG